jgi:membrane-associated protease RseP (regulator of RpoE activity)
MSTHRKYVWSAIAVATIALFALLTPSLDARGGRGGGHAGGFHGGGHHNFHPYRPSQHHFAHHANHTGGEHHVAHRHDHFNHHHHSWHRGGWGPGFWGGAALGYGLGGWAYDGGDTYINNEISNDDASDNDDSSADDDESEVQTTATSTGGFPTDDWPELGINTYAGEYGGTQGMVVVRVVPGSAADKAGIVPGDVILALNGKPTPSADAMEATFQAANLKFTAEVWDARTGRTSTLTGTLDPATPTTAEQKL